MKKNIILGVTGSIAAYKAADIANTLTKEGHSVHVIMTKAGMEFITPLTMQTLTKNKVHTDQFARSDSGCPCYEYCDVRKSDHTAQYQNTVRVRG